MSDSQTSLIPRDKKIAHIDSKFSKCSTANTVERDWKTENVLGSVPNWDKFLDHTFSSENATGRLPKELTAIPRRIRDQSGELRSRLKTAGALDVAGDLGRNNEGAGTGRRPRTWGNRKGRARAQVRPTAELAIARALSGSRTVSPLTLCGSQDDACIDHCILYP